MNDFMITSDPKPLSPLADRVADGNGTTFVVGDALEGLLFIDVTAKSGTNSPTLQLLIEVSPNDSDWFVHSEFDEVTDVSKFVYPLTNFGKYIRIRWVITGTDPSFSFQVKFVVKR